MFPGCFRDVSKSEKKGYSFEKKNIFFRDPLRHPYMGGESGG